ncbi:iron-sulfur cluster-binding protein [Sporocytophaga myxococcoides]|uniref:Iron-sulfur cluster-binding protein n=1 Tax=Sporocytophaga myxococcoides TaxID=153721 RepID=A0A098LAQ1_9BACT|nr:4Fe-4S dicluster domain-containing protein [Sporocytophaga myxococcoides]GAL84000.1 iron-sulfur cluster-binding protein [Sporocytophaga myxococcoides]
MTKPAYLENFSNPSLARKRASYIREITVSNLEKHLKDFETNFSKKGGHVIWCGTYNDVQNEIIRLAEKFSLKKFNISAKAALKLPQSLSGKLENLGLEIISKKNPVTEEKRVLSISEAGFLIAESGNAIITGEALNFFAAGQVTILVADINKVIPSGKDLPLFLDFFSSPEKPLEFQMLSGPLSPAHRLIVILIDGGKTDLLPDPLKRQLVSCIDCMQCVSVCPVNHTDQLIQFPVNSIITPDNVIQHPVYSCTLCGNCTLACPVKIDLQTLLIMKRKDVFAAESKKKHMLTKLFRFAMLKTNIGNKIGGKFKKLLLGYLVKKTWGKRGGLPDSTPRSFNQLWKVVNNYSTKKL